jgi:hypothetical protein
LLPPEADGPVFLSGVWCHVSPAPGKAAAFGDRLTAVSPESSIPDGVAVYINTGIERRARIKKIRRQVRIAENFFRKSL